MRSTTPIRELSRGPDVSPQCARLRRTGRDRFNKRAIFVVLICLVSVVSLLVLWQARFILLLLFAGYIGALILTTLTNAFQSWLHIRRRGLAFAMVLCSIVAVIAAGIWLRGPALAAPLTAVLLGVADVLLPSGTGRPSESAAHARTAAEKFDTRVQVS